MNKDRTEYIKKILVSMGVTFRTQPFRFRILKGENIIVDHFCQSTNKSLLLLTAHSNKYFSSPGANDNASGVAVILGIIELLLERKYGEKLGIKIIFFDHEDGLAYVDGSSYFVDHSDLSCINFVLNLDHVGMGNSITMSPKFTAETKNTYTNHLLDILEKLEVKFHSFQLPPLMVEDHIPFVKKGIAAISLNIMPDTDMRYLIQIEKKPFIIKQRANGICKRKEYVLNNCQQKPWILKHWISLCEDVVCDMDFFPGNTNKLLKFFHRL